MRLSRSPAGNRFEQERLGPIEIGQAGLRSGEVAHPHDHEIERRHDEHILLARTAKGEGVFGKFHGPAPFTHTIPP